MSFHRPRPRPRARSGLPPESRIRIRTRSTLLLVLLGLLLSVPAFAAGTDELCDQTTVILVAGAPGEPEFGSNFVRQVELWTNVCARGHARAVCIGLDEPSAVGDYDCLKQMLAGEANVTNAPLWVVFIGHGTFDGKQARFNLRGPDVSATELREWLKPLRRPLVFINTASASAPFLNQLSGTNRVVVTATRSGDEQNFCRFGLCYAEALMDPASDLDQDGQTSVLEAFLTASAHVAEFYKAQGRLATEHALIDDNGDGLGTSADWFRGVRPVKKAEGSASVDGTHAHQVHLVLSQREQELPPKIRARRDAIELSIARLRDAKSQRPEEEYYRELETLLLDLAAVYGDHL